MEITIFALCCIGVICLTAVLCIIFSKNSVKDVGNTLKELNEEVKKLKEGSEKR